MAEYVVTFWSALVCTLFVLIAGTLHYRIDRSTDKFYSILLILCILVMLGSGIGWIVTAKG